MLNYTIKNDSIIMYNNCEEYDFPKYTSQLINWANQNAQGTRPRVVGQLSELFPEFVASGEEITIDNWHKWYINRFPDALDEATDKIIIQIQNLKEAIPKIDRDLVYHWVEDLVINKTFNGLYIQKAILAFLADKMGMPFRLATPDEEKIGIDGYIGDIPYSIKPDTYKTMARLSESIPVKMIYYTKNKTGLKIEVEE